MSLLRDRRIALLIVGQAINAIGSWCALIAIWGYASFQFHAGAGELALLGVSWALPPMLLSSLAGVPIDRFGPKRVLLVADAAAGVVSLTFLLADSYLTVVLLAALVGAVKAFAEPAFQALPPRLVDDDQLAQANALLATAFQSSLAFGPLVAAVAISRFGVEGAFIVDAITYGVGIAVLIPFRVGPAAVREVSAGVRAELREGFALVRGSSELRGLLGNAAAVYLIWGGFAVLEPIYVRDVIGESTTTFALLQTAFGVGMMISGIIVGRLGDRAAKRSVVAIAIFGSGAAAVIYAATQSLPVAFVGIVVWGTATAWFVGPLMTLIQRAAPIEAHGRVFGVNTTIQNAAHLVSLPLVSLAIGVIGVQFTGVMVGLVPMTVGIRAWRRSRGAVPEANAVIASSNAHGAANHIPAVAGSIDVIDGSVAWSHAKAPGSS